VNAEEELVAWRSVNATRSVDELMVVLQELGPVPISGGRGDYNMAERLQNVLDGAPINQLTRNYGIRQQYIYLAPSPAQSDKSSEGEQ
jgi:hypothetical protein